MPSITLSDEDFKMLPQEAQDAIIEFFLSNDQTSVILGENNQEEEGPPDLSPAQARKIVASCGDQTKDILKFIANSKKPSFLLPDLEKAMNSKSLKGSWTGLTKVTRRILGDPDASLIWWEESDGVHTGTISSMTHTSLKKQFKL